MLLDFNKIQSELLLEAQASPNLLSDLAGLESYIAETYNNRSFIELLQNADDADSSKFYIEYVKDVVIIANNGRYFTESDLVSLCRSASSTKKKGDSIGYRGIGFKSIVGFARFVHLISKKCKMSFSKEDTLKLIPSASKVPLIRIPHKLSPIVENSFSEKISNLQNQGYTTIFIFTGLERYAIEAEIDSFNPISLLFLNNITQMQMRVGNKDTTTFYKKKNEADVKIECSKESSSHWLMYNNKHIQLAFKVISGSIIKLEPKDSIVSAYLPTEDSTGLGILINGNFSTDPSRRHVIFDEASTKLIDEAATLIISLLSDSIKQYSERNAQIINALIPIIDTKILQYQKTSFSKYLVEKIKQRGEQISELNISPAWINLKDYELLTKDSTIPTIDRRFYEMLGFVSFLKFIGAKEMNLREVVNFDLTKISVLGCAEIVKKIIQESIPNYSLELEIYSDLPIFLCENIRRTLNEIKQEQYLVDDLFIALLLETLLSEFDLKSFFKHNISKEYLDKMYLTPKESEVVNLSNIDTSKNESYPRILEYTNISDVNFAINNWLRESSQRKNMPEVINMKWRSAEIQAKELLNSIGFKLNDVSKQNIGYDLEGDDPNGKNIMVEVKSITNVGDKLALTNNEVALAQEKKDKYYLAIIRILDGAIEMMLITDPINNLKLERQAVQWRWVCDIYQYEPIKFDFNL